FDARRNVAYPPYDKLAFDVPLLQEGDVNARVWIRIHEVEQSLSLIEQILAQLPDGPIRVDFAQTGGPHEGRALVEGFRGDILAWLRIGKGGLVER
ncbi:hydrogenase expression protein HypE, partial [Mesorhizobium sp. M00.F.Ca.ET.158.01.1.1]